MGRGQTDTRHFANIHTKNHIQLTSPANRNRQRLTHFLNSGIFKKTHKVLLIFFFFLFSLFTTSVLRPHDLCFPPLWARSFNVRGYKHTADQAGLRQLCFRDWRVHFDLQMQSFFKLQPARKGVAHTEVVRSREESLVIPQTNHVLRCTVFGMEKPYRQA